ncbi:hypothetical protein SAMN04489835_1096 [Mycolicibacterium rutilum]|uniref:Uncharacterized protein n=1 Tax=Mycolicibacterium rutilum TaxID=370526 RepID=A0A1H6J3E2_MYCRU|nr:hypothetical protein [Mycolicibacterium rutilum]SEH53398.1 hypothetical protein SAMN04489835_1096 [Mycolicibacterium rutilum]
MTATGWTEPRLAYLTQRSAGHKILIVALGAAVVVGAVMDAQVMQPALNHILRGHADHVAFISYVIGILTALTMARAGWLLRGAVCDPGLRRREGFAAAVLIAVWAAVGLLITAARRHAAGLAGPAAVGYDGGSAVTANPAVDTAQMAAYVFLGLYAVTGLLAMVDFYCARNDVFDQKLTAHRQLMPARAALIDDEALLHRLAMNLTNATHTFAAITGEGALAKVTQQALVDRLKQLALVRFGIATASTAVLGVASTDHPRNPRARHDGADDEH